MKDFDMMLTFTKKQKKNDKGSNLIEERKKG